jgi:beta-hydroxylase
LNALGEPAQRPEASEGEAATGEPAPQPADPVASNENTLEAGVITRKMMAALSWIEQQNRDYSLHGRAEVFEAEAFAFVGALEANWTLIRGEVARLMMRKDSSAFRETSGDDLTLAQDRGWRTAPLLSYGFRNEATIAQCPETWRLLQNVPHLVGAMFSILEPGRFLPSHRGPYNGVLRLHLGLIVPEPHERIGIRVAHQILRWEEGRALIIDDTVEHEAWNDTDHTRCILFLDFARPLRFPAWLLNALVLRSVVFRPFIREGLDQARWWERRFYREAQAMRRLASADAVKPVSENAAPANENAAPATGGVSPAVTLDGAAGESDPSFR